MSLMHPLMHQVQSQRKFIVSVGPALVLRRRS